MKRVPSCSCVIWCFCQYFPTKHVKFDKDDRMMHWIFNALLCGQSAIVSWWICMKNSFVVVPASHNVSPWKASSCIIYALGGELTVKYVSGIIETIVTWTQTGVGKRVSPTLQHHMKHKYWTAFLSKRVFITKWSKALIESVKMRVLKYYVKNNELFQTWKQSKRK